MNKHTPGPWTINSDVKTSINSDKKHIAMVNFYKSGKDDDVSGEEHEANVRLIASAPELLKSLEEMEKIFGHEKNIPVAPFPARSALDKARLAIAKARGEK
jgi:hypothetical protein